MEGVAPKKLLVQLLTPSPISNRTNPAHVSFDNKNTIQNNFSDTTTGLDCSSKFLADINNQKSKYEGKYVFSILSPDDDVVGYEVCGSKIASSIPNQDKSFKRSGNHDDVLYSTVDLQYSLVLDHKGVL
jgi:hypothetical protein